jgi:hypothetical protein
MAVIPFSSCEANLFERCQRQPPRVAAQALFFDRERVDAGEPAERNAAARLDRTDRYLCSNTEMRRSELSIDEFFLGLETLLLIHLVPCSAQLTGLVVDERNDFPKRQRDCHSVHHRIVLIEIRSREADLSVWAAHFGFPLGGDLKSDETVDGGDLLLWQRQLGIAGAGINPDGNRNGVVDVGDLAIWRTAFGSGVVTIFTSTSGVSSALAVGAVAEAAAGTAISNLLAVGASETRVNSLSNPSATQAYAKSARPRFHSVPTMRCIDDQVFDDWRSSLRSEKADADYIAAPADAAYARDAAIAQVSEDFRHPLRPAFVRTRLHRRDGARR